MDCFTNRGIFLRSNGSIHCGCDAGKSINLQSFDTDIDYAVDVLQGTAYTDIRRHLKKGRLPYPKICTECLLLWADQSFNAGFERDKIIDTIHIEPSFACSIKCVGCPDINERKKTLTKTDAGHLMLEINVLEKILSDLKQGGVEVKKFSLEGHGEPLMNKKVWEMAALTKRFFPDSFSVMITNAHTVFKPEMLNAGLDEIMFSIDGINHATYTPYRKGGNFEKAFAFMKSFSSAAKENHVPVRTIWKYVVFEHNDKPDHLSRAQELAIEANVSELFFVITCQGPVSQSVFTTEDIPIIKNGPRIRIAANTMPIDGLEKRIECRCLALKGDRRDDGEETLIYTMFKRLFSEHPDSAEDHYRFLKKLLYMATSMPPAARGQVLILHDRLLKNNIVKLPKHAPTPTVLFDEDYYLSMYKDVAAAIETGKFKSGFEHYRLCGREEGRIPCASFLDS